MAGQDPKSRPWALPEPCLSQTQRSFLSSFYSPPTNANLEAMPQSHRDRLIEMLCSTSVLARRRLGRPDWLNQNERLLKQACGGDEEAFFSLLNREPRYLCSDLGLLYIAGWQSALDVYDSFFGWNADSRTRDSRKEIQAKLKRISAELSRPFYRRGKKFMPPEHAVKIVYHASRAYFIGLRHMTRHIRNHDARVRRVAELRKEISRISASQIADDAAAHGIGSL